MNEKTFLSNVLILIFMALSVHAYDVEGIIYDYDRTPLQDAVVRLVTAQRQEVGRDFTDTYGVYSIKGIAGGSYTMEISKMGMKQVSQDINVSGTIYQSTIYKDIYLNEIIRFESVKSSELKGLFLEDSETIPLNAFSNYLKGLKKLRKNKFKGAKKAFEKGIKQFPDFSRCYTHLGEIYVNDGKYEQAETSFLKAIELNSADPMPLSGYGKLLVKIEKYELAEKFLIKAVEMEPSRAESYFSLGKAQFYSKKLEEAEKTLIQGLMIQPRESGEARIILADIYLSQKQFSRSRDMLSAYLRENPFATDKAEIKKRLVEIDNLIFSQTPVETLTTD